MSKTVRQKIDKRIPRYSRLILPTFKALKALGGSGNNEEILNQIMPNQSGLQRSNAERAKEAREKALQAITRLRAENQQVNFSTVSKESGLSRCFLYRNTEIKSLIEEQRKCDVSDEINRRAHFDKTSKSKNVIIAAKDKRIAKLEEEIRLLKAEVVTLRGIVYARNKTTADTCSRREESNNTGAEAS